MNNCVRAASPTAYVREERRALGETRLFLVLHPNIALSQLNAAILCDTASDAPPAIAHVREVRHAPAAGHLPCLAQNGGVQRISSERAHTNKTAAPRRSVGGEKVRRTGFGGL